MARAVIQAPSKRAAVVSTTRTFISRIYNAATLGFAASCCRGWAGAISRRDGKLAAASPSYGGLEACRTHRRGRLACAVFSIEARDFTCCLAIDNPLLQIGPLVVRNFAVPHAELGFYLTVLPIELEDDKRAAFHLCLAVELVDLVSMQQQFADAFCGRDFVTGAFVGLNVGVVKESFVVFDSRERIADICLARSDRFDLAAFQFDACFVAVENAIVAKRFAIGNRFACHSARTSSSRNASCRAEDVPRTKRRPRNPRATRNPACQQ